MYVIIISTKSIVQQTQLLHYHYKIEVNTFLDIKPFTPISIKITRKSALILNAVYERYDKGKQLFRHFE